MALSAPRTFFSVHSFNPYSRTDGTPYGELRVLENSSLGVTAELVGLKGGSNKFDWDVEVADMTAEMSLAFSEFPNFVFELFGGNAPVDNAAEALGAVSDALANKLGTVIDATTGIVSVTVKTGSETDLKFGEYLIKVVSETSVDVYLKSGDLDIGRGTNGTMENDLLKITASPLTITDTSGVTEITNFGLEITAGSGTIALVTLGAIGDTATFSVRPQNTASMKVVIGARADQNFPEFGAMVMASKKSDGQMVMIDAYRCKGAGLPLGFNRNTWASAETTVKMMYDDAKDGVFDLEHIITTVP